MGDVWVDGGLRIDDENLTLETLTQLGKVLIFNTGKHADRSFDYVYHNDHDYLVWLSHNREKAKQEVFHTFEWWSTLVRNLRERRADHRSTA